MQVAVRYGGDFVSIFNVVVRGIRGSGCRGNGGVGQNDLNFAIIVEAVPRVERAYVSETTQGKAADEQAGAQPYRSEP